MRLSPLILRRASRAAFTLLEVLLVAALIAIVAVLLFPAFGLMRRHSLEARCAGNLRQIGVAVHLYAGDNSGALPLPYSSQYPFTANKNGLDGDSRLKGFEHLRPYLTAQGNKLEMVRVFHCPGSVFPLADVTQDWSQKTVLRGSYNQYCGWGPKGANSAFLANSSDKITDEGRSKLLFIDLTTRLGSTTSNLSNHRLSDDAPRGANALYIGGHVKWLPVSELTFAVTRAGGTYLFPDPYAP